jgi:SAM-dependent methyltransferase
MNSPVASPVPPGGANSAQAEFLDSARRAIGAGTFESLVLSKNRERAADLRALRVRLIALHGAPALSFTHAHVSRDTTRNLGIDDGLAEIATRLDPGARPAFAHATLRAGDDDLQLMVNRKGDGVLRRHARAAAAGAKGAAPAPSTAPPAPPALAPHDRARPRRLALDLPFLVELGLADERHRLVPSMARKWRQIDKFLEVVDGALDALPARTGDASDTPLRVVDYGCGKGYLTFAVHEHLRRRFGRSPDVLGVELRADLVDFCNAAARRCGMDGLRFEQGDLRSVAPGAVDVMIALHACDTATDHALDLGLRAGAAVLVCSPCCHKELRPQMKRPAALAGVLRHGVHLGQEAEMVTDSLRALLLESCGYDAQVFEFVSLEHTSKNKMILATRRAAPVPPERALAEVQGVKDFYGVREQCLETLLRRRAAVPAGEPV